MDVIYKLIVKDYDSIVYTVSSANYNIIHRKFEEEKEYPIKEVWKINRYINRENSKDIHESSERLIHSEKIKQNEQV
ncbi:MAG: hypothetical protein KatS3mg002_1335 [Candidatus Woesearchaeota archaeon]|nr:MAG: hypothetical protein KatS3mg002_1335 [Candidatus Woesearchaeota archaeon]